MGTSETLHHGRTRYVQPSLLAELPAPPSQSPGQKRDWMTRVATSRFPSLELLQSIAPAGFFGRTCLTVSRSTEDPTLAQFWNDSRDAASKSPKADGKTQGLPKDAPPATGSRGGCLTLNLPEYLSNGDACFLSDFLETGAVLPRYCLSGRACVGILRRADVRETRIPDRLRKALESVASLLRAP